MSAAADSHSCARLTRKRNGWHTEKLRCKGKPFLMMCKEKVCLFCVSGLFFCFSSLCECGEAERMGVLGLRIAQAESWRFGCGSGYVVAVAESSQPVALLCVACACSGCTLLWWLTQQGAEGGKQRCPSDKRMSEGHLRCVMARVAGVRLSEAGAVRASRARLFRQFSQEGAVTSLSFFRTVHTRREACFRGLCPRSSR